MGGREGGQQGRPADSHLPHPPLQFIPHETLFQVTSLTRAIIASFAFIFHGVCLSSHSLVTRFFANLKILARFFLFGAFSDRTPSLFPANASSYHSM